MSKLSQAVEMLLDYAVAKQLITVMDVIYCRNRIYKLLDTAYVAPVSYDTGHTLDQIFDLFFSEEYKRAKGIVFSYQLEAKRAEIMDLFTLKPSEVAHVFSQELLQPQEQLDTFYQYCKDIDYIKSGQKLEKWQITSQYGAIELTINLTKPEKDPKEIARLKLLKNDGKYPLCPLCLENVGNYGNHVYAARSNLRVLPITLANEDWSFQFSPYGYYNQHAILLKNEHTPMKMQEQTFVQLSDFVDQYPHYFIGANAGIPVVGGSILQHEHFQAGVYDFPMMSAQVVRSWEQGTTCIEQLHWPLSVIRISTPSRAEAINYLSSFWKAWSTYTSVDNEILAMTDGELHNAITPIIRKVERQYEVYIALRNNRMNTMYPDGIFHPHPEIHAIKKENIGLIEVMGYAILPGRLQDEMQQIIAHLTSGASNISELGMHQEWVTTLMDEYDFINMDRVVVAEKVKQCVGEIFLHGLEHAGVFKKPKDFSIFIEQVISEQ